MTRLLKLEYFKIRRKKIGLMMTLFLAAEMLWAFMSTSMSIARNPDQAVWASILFTVSSMNGLFMPMVTAVVVSRICDMEHKGATWKLLASFNVSRSRLYAAKYGCANSLLLVVVLLQAILIAGFGLMKGVPGNLPVAWLIRFTGGTMLATLAVTAIQQWIAMAVKNQAFALCLGMLGSFAGLTAPLFPADVRRWLVWSYYLDLGPVTYQFAESSGSYIAQPWSPGIAAAALGTALLFYFAGNLHVARQEI